MGRVLAFTFGPLLILAATAAVLSGPARPRPVVAYCPSPAGLFVPCRDADRITKREWDI